MTKPGKLLAVDTATEICGIAVIADGRIRAELSLSHGETHSMHILKAIDAVLGLDGTALTEIDAFAVTRGPGSFTGLRIGISTVKGLAFAAGKPIIGISSLEVLAHQAGGESGLVCSAIDARRNEIYWRIYRRRGDALTSITPEHVGPVDQLAGQIDDTCVLVGNAAFQYNAQIRSLVKYEIHLVPETNNAIRPAVLAQLAWQRFRLGRIDDVKTFGPVYIRKSDAEMKRLDQGREQ